MTEYIGSRISLISKSDIRYVGKLHNINSEDSTVALENVRSFGTEGRKAADGRAGEEIPPSDAVYEYIVFRGSDVKDLRIEEGPAEPPPAPQVPNDPAILNSARPTPRNGPNAQQNFQQPPRQQQHQHQHQQQGPPLPQQSFQPYQQYGQPPNQRFQGPPDGFHGPPNGGFQPYPGPYGPPPPGWYPPPGQGHHYGPPPGQFSPSQHPQMPYGGPGPHNHEHMPPRSGHQPTHGNAPLQRQDQNQVAAPPAELQSKDANPAPVPMSTQAAQLAAETESDAVTPAKAEQEQTMPVAPAPSKVALPFAKIAARTTAAQPSVPEAARTGGPSAASKTVNPTAANAQMQYQNAARAASAAVAAAMAKLAPAGSNQASSAGVNNLIEKVNEMRVDDRNRHPRGGRGDHARGRGGQRSRGGREAQNKSLKVPTTDFDFEGANAKFNKEEVVKEASSTGEVNGGADAAIGSIVGTSLNGDGAKDEHDAGTTPPVPAAYTKSSFFDNISSEAKDRVEGTGGAGGREFRGQERRRNMETFGQGSVDGGDYRGGFRGRGGGRGRGFGRGGPRGEGGARASMRGGGDVEA